MISDSLRDEHILELSRLIPSGEELLKFGITVLKLSDCKIKAAMYDHSDSIQEATHELLSKWLNRQTNRKEAYVNLYSALRKGGMEQQASQLKQWVEGVEDESKEQLICVGILVFQKISCKKI